MQWEKDSLFNKWCWENWTTTCKIMKLDPFFTPYTNINSKWFEDLNVNPESIQIPQESTGSNLFDIRGNNFVLAMSPEARETKTKISYWGYIKIKTQQKKQPTKLKDNLLNGRKYLQMTFLIRN